MSEYRFAAGDMLQETWSWS